VDERLLGLADDAVREAADPDPDADYPDPDPDLDYLDPDPDPDPHPDLDPDPDPGAGLRSTSRRLGSKVFSMTAADRKAARQSWEARLFRGGRWEDMAQYDALFWNRTEDFLDLISALNDADARFLVVGPRQAARSEGPGRVGVEAALERLERAKRQP